MNEKIRMTKPVTIAFYLNLLLVLMGLTFGLRYLLAPELLSYHLRAMGLNNWSDVALQYRTMLMVFIKVAGLGMTTSSVCLALILFNAFRRNENWARWGFLLVFSIHYIPLSMNMIYLKLNTPSSPPYMASLFALAVAFIAFLMSGDMKRVNSRM